MFAEPPLGKLEVAILMAKQGSGFNHIHRHLLYFHPHSLVGNTKRKADLERGMGSCRSHYLSMGFPVSFV
jgi:hypothetical protein